MASPESADVTVGVEFVGAHTVDSRAFWLDLLDRTGRTFLQNVLIFLGAGTLLDVSWPTALSSAALAALVSLLLALATSTAITSGNFWIDLADRAARTFAGTLVGAIPATGTLADVNWPDVLLIAITATVVSILTSLLTMNLGSTKGVPSLAPVQPELMAVEVDGESEVLAEGEVSYRFHTADTAAASAAAAASTTAAEASTAAERARDDRE
jgi:hypothetical protein